MASLRSAARLTKNARSLLSRVAAYELPAAAGTAARTLPAALRTFSAAAEPAKAPIIENVSVWRRGAGGCTESLGAAPPPQPLPAPPPLPALPLTLSAPRPARPLQDMFCYPCEQTKSGTGCTTIGERFVP